jgi:hypothetical protein
VNSGKEQDHTDGESLFDNRGICPEEGLRIGPEEVFAKADGRGCNRRKNPRSRSPAAEKSQERMIQFRKESIFTARMWYCSSERSVRKGTAEGDDATNNPQGKHEKRIAEIAHEQSAGGKDPRANHVGYNDVR